MVKNDALYKSCKQLVLSSLDLLQNKTKKSKIPTYVDENIKREDNGSFKFLSEEKPFFIAFISKYMNEIKELPQFEVFKTNLIADEKINKQINHLVGTRNFQFRIDLDRIIEIILTKMLEQSNLEFEERFNSVYKEFEDFFYSDKLTYIVFSPLQHFDCQINEFKLNERLSIRKITDEEKNQLWKMLKFSHIPTIDIHFLHYGIFDVCQPDKIIIEDGSVSKLDEKISETQLMKDSIRRLISALRLFKKGSFGTNLIQFTPVGNPFGFGFSTSEIGYKSFLGPTYILCKEEIEIFLNFWNDIKQVVQITPKFLSIAIQRFDFGIERVRIEDKLIDYMISFESLFLKEDEKLELKYKLANRVAILFGKDGNEARKIFNFINKAYILRSKIVHGTDIKNVIRIGSQNITLNDFVIQLEDHLRESIKYFIKLIKTLSYNEIIELLDNSLIDNESKTRLKNFIY